MKTIVILVIACLFQMSIQSIRRVHAGQEVVIDTYCNPSTGYSWNIKPSVAVMKLTTLTAKSQFKALPKPAASRMMMGAPTRCRLTFRVRSSARGKQISIKIAYRRSWEKNVPASDVRTITLQA